MVEAARKVIDPEHPDFLAPPDMNHAIRNFCRRTGQSEPESLALRSRKALRELEGLLKTRFLVLHIVGGGSLNPLLCQFTADAAGVPVLAGPSEATAIGNLLVQAVAVSQLKCVEEVRAVVRRSTRLVEFLPRGGRTWEHRYARYLSIASLPAASKTARLPGAA